MRGLSIRVAARLLLAAAATGAMAGAHAQHRAHVHGFAALNIALQGGRLSVQLEAPLDSLLGFEHKPRTDAQRKAADAALALLNKPQDWLQPDAAAQCTATRTEVRADVLLPDAKSDAKPDAKSATPAAASAHADLDASVDFQCAAPERLQRLQLKLFDAFPRLNRIDVQVVGPQGQGQQTLRRPASTVRLTR